MVNVVAAATAIAVDEERREEVQPVLVIEIKVPLSSGSVIDQSMTISAAAQALETLMQALPEGATRTERIIKTGRDESNPRRPRAPAPISQAVE